jgi:hypothetical protein
VVYFFERTGGAWRRQAVKAGPAADGFFGFSVALSGTTAVIGAPLAGGQTGRAYVYVRSGPSWRLQATLSPPPGAAHGEFGLHVAVSGSIAVVGAPFYRNHGVAYVYASSGANWFLAGTLNDPHPVKNDQFGNAVAVSGLTAVVGEVHNNRNTGAAYIFAASGSGWIRQATLTAPHRVRGNDFGWSVAISGTRVLIGSPARPSNSAGALSSSPAQDASGRSDRLWRTLAAP